MEKNELSIEELREKASKDYDKKIDSVNKQKKLIPDCDKFFKGAIACLSAGLFAGVAMFVSLFGLNSMITATISSAILGVSAAGSLIFEIYGSKYKKQYHLAEKQEKECFYEYCNELDRIKELENSLNQEKQDHKKYSTKQTLLTNDTETTTTKDEELSR